MDELAARVAVATTPGVGPLRFDALLARFGSAAAALAAAPGDVAAATGWGERLAGELRRRAGEGERVLERCRALGVEVLDRRDPRYPAALQFIPAPPPVLFARGDVDAFRDRTGIAIIGARRCTAYGRRMAQALAADLATAGLLVVSGLARGVDGAAHQGALAAARDGPVTVAVLGSGIDVIYPPEHRNLAAAVAERGLLLSEFPPGAPPHRHHFPRRNRIISGCSRGVIVVEAAQRSGTRLTVDFAADQGRDVFAVPGPANSPLSAGPHGLLREGAHWCTCAADVLREWALGPAAATPNAAPGAAPLRTTTTQRRLLDALDGGVPVGLDEICALTGTAPGDALADLLELELQGLVRQLPGQQFLRV